MQTFLREQEIAQIARHMPRAAVDGAVMDPDQQRFICLHFREIVPTMRRIVRHPRGLEGEPVRQMLEAAPVEMQMQAGLIAEEFDRVEIVRLQRDGIAGAHGYGAGFAQHALAGVSPLSMRS